MFNISDDTVAWMEGDFVSKEVHDVAEEREFIYLGQMSQLICRRHLIAPHKGSWRPKDPRVESSSKDNRAQTYLITCQTQQINQGVSYFTHIRNVMLLKYISSIGTLINECLSFYLVKNSGSFSSHLDAAGCNSVDQQSQRNSSAATASCISGEEQADLFRRRQQSSSRDSVGTPSVRGSAMTDHRVRSRSRSR